MGRVTCAGGGLSSTTIRCPPSSVSSLRGTRVFYTSFCREDDLLDMVDTPSQPVASSSKTSFLPAKSWQHFVGGG